MENLQETSKKVLIAYVGFIFQCMDITEILTLEYDDLNGQAQISKKHFNKLWHWCHEERDKRNPDGSRKAGYVMTPLPIFP